MKFRNDTKEKVKVRTQVDSTKPGFMAREYIWKTVKPGEEIELPEDYGRKLGFTQVTLMKKIVEAIKPEPEVIPEPQPDEGFFDKLRAIKGIGRKTVKDIIAVYPDEPSIRMAIANDEALPFDDNIADKLKNEFKD